MRSRVFAKWDMSLLAVVAGLVVAVAGFTVARPAEQPFCNADNVLDPGIPSGYGYGRDTQNGCAWTVYAPDGSPAPASAYADTFMISYPGSRPSTVENLAPYLMLPTLGLGLIAAGVWGAWTARRRKRDDRGRPQVHGS